MKVTIKDIAKMAGVSHPTVSKALNNEPGVSEETREKILNIAKQVNYVPNLAARRLADKKTNSIGLVWPQGEGLFFYHLCNKIQKEAASKGINVIMSLAEESFALRTFNEHFVDMAVAWIGPEWTPSIDFLKEKESMQGELLLIGGGRIANAHRISINRIKGIYNAVKYLSDLGHKRIAFIGEQSEKMMGFMQGMLEFKLEYHKEYTFVTNPRDCYTEELDKFVEGILLNDAGASALIVDSQGALFNTIKLLRKHRISIPEKLSIMVYDDIPEMEIFDIPLTTVGPSIKKIAGSVIDIFIKINNKEASEYVDIEIMPDITVRESTRAFEV